MTNPPEIPPVLSNLNGTGTSNITSEMNNTLPIGMPIALDLKMTLIILGALVGIIVAGLLVMKARGLTGHPQISKLGQWIKDPEIEALAIGIDVDTKEMKIFPVKKVGEFYVWGNKFIIPVDGGEQYTYLGKPVFVSILYGRYGVKWIPAHNQIVNLSLKPIDAEPDIQATMERLITEIVSEKAQLTGTVVIAPNQSLYISVKPNLVMDNLMKTLAFGVDALTAVIQNSIKSVEREGTSILQATAAYIESKSRSIVMIVFGIALAVAIALFILKSAGII